MASRLARSVLAPAGAAMSVTAISWIGEQGASKILVSSRAASQALFRNNACQLLRRSQSKTTTTTTRYFSTETKSKATATTTATAEKVAKSAEPAASAAAAPKQQQSFMQWYEGHLQASPVKTKMVTGAILWGIGDAVAQLVPQVSAPSPDFQYDIPRTSRAAIFGFALHAPTSHLHFNFLEWMTQRAGVSGLGIPVFKAFMEQFVYWSWISNSMYHGAMGAMQGMGPSEIYQRIEDVLWETQKAQWAFWIPIQLLNFRFIPVRHQLNVVLLTSIVWTALLSAWYPPEDDNKNKIENNNGNHKSATKQ